MPQILATATILRRSEFFGTAAAVYLGSFSILLRRVRQRALLHFLRRPRSTAHAPITATTAVNTFTIPFQQVRGGDLVVKVSVLVGGAVLTAQSQDLQIVGTNPLITSLDASAPQKDAFRKLMRLESGLRQFLSPSCPLYSSDNLGGVGLCQLTPPPNEDAVWSWKANLAAGVRLYNEKENIAKAYPGNVRSGAVAANLTTGDTFPKLVTAYNAKRQSDKKQPVQVQLPEFNDEQLQRDTLRGFNGFAGGLHEYRVQLDKDGQLAVVESGATATAQWELVTAAMRTAYYGSVNLAANRRGDVNYVEDVLKQQSF